MILRHSWYHQRSKPITDCLKALAGVSEATFGYHFSSNYEEVTEQLGVTFSRLMSQFQLSMTIKVHILLRHVPHFIRVTGMALCPEEQHRRYKTFFNRYRTNCTENISCPGRFLNSVLHYNSYHI